jgi:riboflavin synthase
MFTGIVETLGRVVAVEDLGTAARLTVEAPDVAAGLGEGDSVAVNGVCLTVVTHDAAGFTADVMLETLRRSGLGGLTPGAGVNLERAMPADGRFGGHVVQGHVDGTGIVRERRPDEHWTVVRVALPEGLARYVVEKGSITVDGVSLTVVEVGEDGDGPWFSVSLIPTTLELTTLGRRAPGEPVNLEVDVVAKYVERLLSWRSP